MTWPAAHVAELGEVETLRRESHVWQMTIRRDGSLPLDGAAPLLIQRASRLSPAAALPQHGLKLQRLLIRHPTPARVLALFANIELDPHPTVSGGTRQHVQPRRRDRDAFGTQATG